jgi:hypothetical protein
VTIEFVSGKEPSPKILPELQVAVKERAEAHRAALMSPLQNYGSAEYDALHRLMYHDPPPPTGCTIGMRPKWRNFSEGLLNVVASGPDGTKEMHQCFIDPDLEIKFQLPTEVIDTGAFHDGLAAIVVPSQNSQRKVGKDGLLGFIDKSGATVIAPQLQIGRWFRNAADSFEFSDGLAVLHLEEDIVIDRSGKVVQSLPAKTMQDFVDGLAPHSVLVDKNGKVIAADDLSTGYQSRAAYETAVKKLLQAELKQSIFPRPVEFDIVPEGMPEITLHDTETEENAEQEVIVLPDRGIIRFPMDGRERLINMIFNNLRVPSLHPRWDSLSRASKHLMREDPIPAEIRGHVENIKMPTRSTALRNIVLHFSLDNGTVLSLRPPTFEPAIASQLQMFEIRRQQMLQTRKRNNN